MSRSTDRRSINAELFTCSIPIAIGLGFLYYGWTSLQDARASVNWPVAPGKIVTSNVKTHTSYDSDTGRTTTYDSTTVEYVYTVDGAEYSGDVVRFGAPRPGGRSRNFRQPGPGRRQSPKYPVGKAVSVSYKLVM